MISELARDSQQCGSDYRVLFQLITQTPRKSIYEATYLPLISSNVKTQPKRNENAAAMTPALIRPLSTLPNGARRVLEKCIQRCE